jgi:hypothetical protein
MMPPSCTYAVSQNDRFLHVGWFVVALLLCGLVAVAVDVFRSMNSCSESTGCMGSCSVDSIDGISSGWHDEKGVPCAVT